uniref:Uncharacterized protein n=1 Tax=Utricularia reniformis TaxID=192314 RepID=A0A1Y0B4V1_9LAMI|nr:hypothetical protein AEK19_MT2283 [Utricularia reniformis]ART32428.1 hypothetical protein AEK19_MT2283 [Utricularia reniformis]
MQVWELRVVLSLRCLLLSHNCLRKSYLVVVIETELRDLLYRLR